MDKPTGNLRFVKRGTLRILEQQIAIHNALGTHMFDVWKEVPFVDEDEELEQSE